MIDHSLYKEKSVQGRYVNMEAIQPCFAKLPFPLLHIGDSVRGIEINAFKLGQGTKKVLMWSQMHGNESTTTKAVWDMVNFLQSGVPLAHDILKECSIMVVPMLNPDGADLYTRENINKVDLNRDAKNLTQPESIALRGLFESFQPDFCFNLHDQRTLFSAGNTNKSATVSFLSPASNAERHITPPREIAMKLIVGMNTMLQKYIPGQVGRYDDGFNDNCVGDTFQMLASRRFCLNLDIAPVIMKGKKLGNIFSFPFWKRLKLLGKMVLKIIRQEIIFQSLGIVSCFLISL